MSGACQDLIWIIFINIDYYPVAWASKKKYVTYVTFRIFYRTFDWVSNRRVWHRLDESTKVSNSDKFEAIRVTLKTAPPWEKSLQATCSFCFISETPGRLSYDVGCSRSVGVNFTDAFLHLDTKPFAIVECTWPRAPARIKLKLNRASREKQYEKRGMERWREKLG